MIFKDRREAGTQLAALLEKKRIFAAYPGGVILSVLRGGAPVGDVLAKHFSLPHLPLPSVKIGAPGQEELAMGALCFDKYYIDPRALSFFGIKAREVDLQTIRAKEKMDAYIKSFSIKKDSYGMVGGKVAVIVDDGIASGATIHASALFVRSCSPERIVIASPVSSSDFFPGRDVETAILDVEKKMEAVSRHYEDFSPVEDGEVRRIFAPSR